VAEQRQKPLDLGSIPSLPRSTQIQVKGTWTIKGPPQRGRTGNEMPRNKNQNADVETVEETEEVATPEASAEGETKTTKKAEPKRGTLPEGYVTPVGLAKVIGEKGLQTNREGEVLSEVKPQMVYSYMKNAPKDDPFPIETVTDSIGAERQAVKVEAALEWWTRKNERTAQRSTNAAEKKAKKEAAAAAKAQAATEAEDAGDTEPATEAE
jgi:hypothetical protein